MLGLVLLAADLFQELLDELLLILRRSHNGRTLLLLLLTTTRGEPGSTENSSEGSHGQDVRADLLAGDLVVLDHCEGQRDGMGSREVQGRIEAIG